MTEQTRPIVQFDPTFLPVVVTSCITFLLLYKYLNPFLSKTFSTEYRNLSESQKIDWSTRINSSIISFVVGSVCVYMMIADRELEANPLLYKSYLLKANLSLVIGYLFSDTLISLIHYKKIGDPFTLAHHLVAMYAFAYVLTLNVMPYFGNFRLLAELSTPLVNIRWFLDALKYPRESKVFVLNGLLMTVVFFLVRIVTIPIYWWKVSLAASTPLWSHMGHFRYVLIIVCIVLDLINLYWFSKMVRGCLRILSKRNEKKQR